MALAPGRHLGPYEIAALIGVGGMGEVYRARDTKLNRNVALKVMPGASALDPNRVSRFTREAQVLASLNHPHIAAIYGFEDSGDTHALVLELVEGETLADRIARGPIPIDEALPIARQIGEALEAAHELSIIHRDLKPSNIKITRDGVVKILDFGLAKLMDPAHAPASDVSLSPTITSPAVTQAGMILGTPAYMSPEQAQGRPADKRSDLWAFGCVLFEMLTGTRPFHAEDVTDVLVAVLSKEPEWIALPVRVPEPIRALIRRCLEKDRRKRIADIAAALFALDESANLDESATEQARPLSRRIVIPVAAALVTSTVVGAGVWIATRPGYVPPSVSRLSIASSRTAALTINGSDRDIAITPDGSRVVYIGNRGTQLFVRALDAIEPVAVFTGSPREPFVSPDSQWIGFVDNGDVLKKVALTGGPAVTLATLDSTAPRGATWGPEDTIIVATANGTTGLQQVAAGASTRVLTRPDRAQGEADHLWPERLPGGRAVLFTITAVTGGLDAAQVAVLDLQSGTYRLLVRGGSHAHFVRDKPQGWSPQNDRGYLVYAAAGTMRAVPFDLGRLETRGTSVPVIANVLTTSAGAMDSAVANDGTLAYVSGVLGGEQTRTLVWVDRQGHETPIPAPPRAYVYPRLSPDGTRIAVYAADQELDLWVWDLRRTTLTRVTFDPAIDAFPVWTSDGHRVIFSSDRNGARNLFWQPADGSGAVERLTETSNSQYATDVSPDGRRLIFSEVAPKTRDDVIEIRLDETRRVTPVVQSSFAERNGVVSPNGRWLAYETNDSGRFEISVRPFPDVNNGQWRVSTAGGTRPLWTPGGQELIYVSPAGALMGVQVARGPSWVATTPTLLVKEDYFTTPGNPGRTYDIARDGQRFLMIKQGGADQTAAPPQVIVVQHWVEELKRLVPTR